MFSYVGYVGYVGMQLSGCTVVLLCCCVGDVICVETIDD